MVLPQLSQADQLKVLLHQEFAKPHTPLSLPSLEPLQLALAAYLAEPRVLRSLLDPVPLLARLVAVSQASSADQWPVNTLKIKRSKPSASTTMNNVQLTPLQIQNLPLSVD